MEIIGVPRRAERLACCCDQYSSTGRLQNYTCLSAILTDIVRLTVTKEGAREMSATSAVARAMPAPTQPDLGAIKARQQGAWSSGDYAVVGTTLQIVGETLCEALDLRAGQRVLDVAAGNGNVTLAAARRWCEVVSTDYVSTLLDRARALGHGRAHHRVVRATGLLDPARATRVRVSLPRGAALARRLQDLLRPAVEDIRCARSQGATGADRGSVRADQAVQSLRRCNH